MTVAVLFARRDSIYKAMPGCDVWDIDRDARNWPGGAPVVAHPPCRAWGRLRHFAKPRADEKALAIFAVDQVRRWGGVLEHPRASTLWAEMALPTGYATDLHGGFSMSVDQSWWGHPCRKSSLLYICGIGRADVPRLPFSLALPPKLVDCDRRDKGRFSGVHLPKSQRELTPPDMALWLVDLAGRCRPSIERSAA